MRRRLPLRCPAFVASAIALLLGAGALRAQGTTPPTAKDSQPAVKPFEKPAALARGDTAGVVTSEPALGGTVWRFEDAEFGPVRVWRPKGYVRRTAGIVVYVHGHATTVDSAWTDHQLGEQFAASHQNALYIIPESPQYGGDRTRWPKLDALFEAVAAAIGEPMPRGPVVVVGHSGAFKEIAQWLDDARVRHIILLDGLYGNEGDFRAWYLRGDRKFTLVAFETRRHTDFFRKGLRDVARLKRVPKAFEDFTGRQRRARLLIMRSQYEHMEIVTSGQVIPVLLRLSALRRISEKPATAGAGRSSRRAKP